jgi:fructan beta-fructosidase
LSTYSPGSVSGDRNGVLVNSPLFMVDFNVINFLISGGNHPEDARINLVIDGAAVRRASGDNSDLMKWVSWDVCEFRGKTASIQIVDNHTAVDYGTLNVDHIVFSNTAVMSGREHPIGWTLARTITRRAPIEPLIKFKTGL